MAAANGAIDLASFGYRRFRTPAGMMVALRTEVMLKMIRQQHELELSPPGTYETSIVGTDEGWWYRPESKVRERLSPLMQRRF